ncbi:MAG TPA: hypothetical protein P5250_03050 [Bacteroidales bacterium]|nr:hypothetical protein [Bacteroidales bacterium]
MKALKVFISLTFCLTIPIIIQAQDKTDALRYSQIYFGGTARSLGLAGAFGSAGADFFSASVNPAGIGLYKSSEITFSPSFYSGNTFTNYNETETEDQKFNVNINNVGMVWNFDIKKDKEGEDSDYGWNNFQLAFGINRLNNFNNRIIIQGNSKSSSLLDVFVSQANGLKPENLDKFGSALAFNTYLIDTLVGGNTEYYSVLPNSGVLQRKLLTTSGGINEMVINLAANYSDKLYIGGTLGLPIIRYYEQSQYYEIDNADTLPNFKSFTYSEDLATSGSGFNFKFGIIYRLNDYVRLGAAVQTPTFFTLKDSYSKKIKSNLETANYQDNSPLGVFNYELMTPMRATGNIAFIIGRLGMLNVDYEFVDYSDSKLNSSNYKFFDENESIRNSYTVANNIRVGGEIVLAPFSVRGGYAYYGSPYKTGLNDGKKSFVTFGMGVKEKGYFIDLAYIYSLSKEDYYLYPNVSSPAHNKMINHNVVLTFGLKY